jgi:myo-inositol-1(or 4)-monophosphatase
VTAADKKAEDVIFEELSKARPGYGFLMEERGLVEGTDKSHRWVVDPLDGTTNFMHGIPHFATSIGLERDGVPVAGVIYNPITDDLFYGEKGKAAFYNDKRLRVSARRGLADAVIATGIPFRGKPGQAQFLVELHKLMPEVAGVRRFGSAALDMAWVAAGRFDAFWERDLKPWDLCAGAVIVREAGGITRDLDGGADPVASGAIAAGPQEVVDPLMEAIKAAGG